jgi:hypothetical protein
MPATPSNEQKRDSLAPAVHIVFSRPPQHVSEGQYDQWHATHIAQALGRPEFAAAARYALVPALDEPAEPDRFTRAAVYEIEVSASEASATAAARVAAGQADLPDWFGAVHVASWLAHPLGPRIGPGATSGSNVRPSLQLVFSDAGDADHPVSDESFDGWYERHLDEILSIPGFSSAQRYRLEEVTRPADGMIPGRRLCMYTTTKPPDELRAEMERMDLLSADSYSRLKDTDSSGPALPEWWDRVRFASWNLIPL